jgi:hypothetical protein
MPRAFARTPAIAGTPAIGRYACYCTQAVHGDEWPILLGACAPNLIRLSL